MYLQCAQLILDGARPYVDFVDLNPPLVMFLDLPPAWVARVTGTPVTIWFNLFVTALVALSAWQIGRVARRRLDPGVSEWAPLIWALTSMALLPSGDWGQREHLFVLLAGPALFAAGMELDARLERGERFALGFQLALGALLKPHFFVVVALIELLRLRCSGVKGALWSSHVAGMLVPAVGYAAYWVLCPAEVRQAFFGRWVPLIRAGYDAYSDPLSIAVLGLLRRPPTVALCLALAGVAALGQRLGSLRPLASALGAAAFLSELMAVQQRKGWWYHEIPFMLFGLAMVVLATFQLVRPRIPTRLFAPAMALVAVAISCLIATSGRPNPDMPAFAEAVRKHSQPGDAVLVLSSDVWPAYNALTITDRRPGSRLLWLFPVAMLRSMGEPLDGPNVRRLAAELIEDLDQRRPRLVIAPTSARIEKPFIERHLRARIARDYARVGPIDRDFELFERRP
jgi:hypothetical protein